MDAVNDEVTLQILYEGKTADTALNEKHAFDEAFEDLFKERSAEDLLAIKKKYGATGDLLEAENRINAIAKDLVNHYVDNILPNGFKAQVVCHSKLACIRYQNGIRNALTERIAAEEQKATPDTALLAQLKFLKTAVVISSDGTNEAAFVTQARKEAARLNATNNFCKAFNQEDPDAAGTGIAFLIVCDMLLTGFDAPIEQVMYIDKKLREHTLLQAIARTNRVARGKQRGYIVDYIGLANHLTDALTIYAASDEMQELHSGLQNISSELPVLDERYQRLLQHFDALGVKNIRRFVNGESPGLAADAEVVHAAVTALKNERHRADFGVYLKKFLMSMDVVMPHASAQAFRVPAKRFGYILAVAKERYKDTSLSLGNAGEKVKALINMHLISLGINPKVEPVELLASDFMEKLAAHAGDNVAAKASEMEHAIRKHCTVHHDEDPAFFKSLSAKVDALIEKHHEQWDLLAEKLTELRTHAIAGRTHAGAGMEREASTFYDHIVQIGFADGVVSETDQAALEKLVRELVGLLQETLGGLDFWLNADQQKRLRGAIKTEIAKANIEGLKARRERVTLEIMKLAKNRHSLLLAASQHRGP
jgi:type I restriction enzyme R subunit